MNVPPPPIPQWSPSEKLELFCEIIKSHGLPPEAILPIVSNLAEPRWEELPLPRGRPLNQCRQVYYESVRQASALPLGLSRSASVHETPRPLDIAGTKRPYGAEGSSSAHMIAQRYQDIQPKPPGLGTLPNLYETAEPQKKKRGRPTKAESEMRREAAARQRDATYPNIRRDTVIQPGPFNAPSVAQQAALAAMTPPLQSLSVPTAPPRETSGETRKKIKLAGEDIASRPPDHLSTVPEELLERRRHHHDRTPSRDYPDILTRQPDERPSSFRAPRGE